MIGEAVVTDISPGMLCALERSARELGEQVETAACEASELPFADDEFDLVFGHAVLHHLPDLDVAFGEFRRAAARGRGGLLRRALTLRRPSGRGSQARSVGAGPAVAGLDGCRAPRRRQRAVLWSEEDLLEQEVDVHAFTPAALSAHAESAGFTDVRVRGEELAASLFGWANRTLEASAELDGIPWAWRVYAHRGYLLLQTVDRSLLEPRLPAALFYNLLVSGKAR